MPLSRKLKQKIINFLGCLPNISDVQGRRAFIYSVGLDPQLIKQIPFDQPPATFIPLLVSLLSDYGTLNTEGDALGTALEIAKEYVGQEKQAQCDLLISEINLSKKKGEQKKIFRKVRYLKEKFIIAVVLIIGLSCVLYGLQKRQSTITFQDGVFGMLVVPFEGVTEEGIKRGIQLQHDTVSTLNARFKEMGIEDVIAMKLLSSSPDYITSHREAREIGRKYHAELVMWGQINSIAVIPNLTLVNPSLEISKVIEPETTMLKETLSHAALSRIHDIRFPALTDELTTLAAFVTGLKFYQHADYQKALEYFNTALSETPLSYVNNAFINFYLGHAYASLQRYDSAIIEYTKGIEATPQDAFAYYYNRGAAYTCAGDYDKAEEDYQQAMQLNSDMEPDTYNGIGANYIYKGEFDSAIDFFSKALEIDSKYADAYYNRGVTYRLKGHYEEALKDFISAVSYAPNDPDIYLERAFIYRIMENYKQAITDYSKALSLKPENAAIYVDRGFTYRLVGDYDLAIADYMKALELSYDNSARYSDLCAIYTLKEDYTQALDACNSSIKLDPDAFWGYTNRAMIYMLTEEYELAIADYTKTLEVKPDYVEGYIMRGQAYSLNSESELAFNDYSKAIELAPTNKFAYTYRGKFYHDTQKYRLAISDYTNAISYYDNETSKTPLIHLNSHFTIYAFYGKNFSKSDLYRSRALSLSEIGQHEDAIADYSESIKLDPNDFRSYGLRGVSFAATGDYTSAIKDYNKVLKINPDDVRAYIQRGLAYFERGEYTKAISDQSKALKLNPKEISAYGNRASAYRKQGKCALSINDYSAIIEIDPQNARAYFERALAVMECNQYEQAIADFSHIITFIPDDICIPCVYYGRGNIYSKIGEYAKAISDYDEMLALDKDFIDAHLRKALAYEALGDKKNALASYRAFIDSAPSHDISETDKVFAERKIVELRTMQ